MNIKNLDWDMLPEIKGWHKGDRVPEELDMDHEYATIVRFWSDLDQQYWLHTSIDYVVYDGETKTFQWIANSLLNQDNDHPEIILYWKRATPFRGDAARKKVLDISTAMIEKGEITYELIPPKKYEPGFDSREGSDGTDQLSGH